MDLWLSAFCVIVLLHLICAPMTKVEESFNIQAAHDLLFHGLSIKNYDHKNFPGVVPRSFAGAAVLALLLKPLAAAFPDFSRTWAQHATRAVLGALLCCSMATLRLAVARRTGSQLAGTLFLVLSSAQFHVPFYATRTLPNTFAMVLSCSAWACWLEERRPRATIILLTVTTAVFRCDLLPLLAMVGLHVMWSRQMEPTAALCTGLASVAAAAAATVPFDSQLWGRTVWPELEVFWFNVIGNRSSEWGVSPWHWYFTSALPRALMWAMPLWMVCPFLQPRMRPAALLPMAFVACYSFLPHKEVRFLMPVLPLCTAAAAASAASIYQRCQRSMLGRLMWCVCSWSAIVTSLAALGLMTAASHHNYPGGAALERLPLLGATSNSTVHVAPHAAINGVTRFQARRLGLHIDKTEDISVETLQKFDFLLNGQESIDGFRMVHQEHSFNKFRWSTSRWPLLDMCLQPQIYVHKRGMNVSDVVGCNMKIQNIVSGICEREKINREECASY